MSRVSHRDAGKPRRLSPLQHGVASPLSRNKNYDEHVLPNPSDRTDQQAPAMTENKLASFVQERKFEQLECKRYVTDPKSQEGACYCGRAKPWHEMKSLKMNHTHKQIWESKTHTKPSPSQAYGEIQFQGFGKENIRSPYIRLSPETDPRDVFDLLTNHWKLPRPKLLISVTGGATKFKLSEQRKADLKRRLIKLATSTGAWITTGGTGTGVMQLVGEAVRDHMITLGGNDNSVVALGIFNWGCIDNRKVLHDNKNHPTGAMSQRKRLYDEKLSSLDDEPQQSGDGLFPAQYNRDELDEEGTDTPLDHNQTHFILVDDGTEGKIGREIEFRVKLEKYVSGTNLPQSQDVSVPVIMLVVEGGVNTIKTVHEAIQQDIPVLVLNGSGRAADFIAKGYQLRKDHTNEGDFDEDMKAYARENLYKSRHNVEKKISESLKQLKDFLKKMWLVSVTEADNDDIDGAILYALIKANNEPKMIAKEQLALVLAWDRCDIARHHILTQKNVKNIHLYDTMVTALVQDKKEFVQLLCENGVSMHKFLKKETLWTLYTHVLTQDSPMSKLLRNTLPYSEESMSSYDPKLLQSIGRLMVHLLKDDKMSFYDVDDDKMRIMAERELFIWAILSNRRELGGKFWRSCPDQLGAALVGSALLKALAEKAKRYEELVLHKDLNEHANLYEDRAVGVLDECYSNDPGKAHQLLDRLLYNYGGTTIFSLARTFAVMRFMSTTCCQTKLDIIWMGRMVPYTRSWKILLTVCLPFFVPIIKLTPLELEQNEKESETRQNDSKNTPITGAVEKDERSCKKRCSNIKKGFVDFLWALVYFYSAPVTVFITNTISYVVFLSIFTYFVLTDLHPSTVSTLEYITWGWISTMGIEEIRQIVCSDRLSWTSKIRDWIGTAWNKFDLLMIIIFLASVILRYIVSGDNFVYARILYSITLAMYFLRLMQTFYFEENMGPKVIMIWDMLADLSYLLAIFIVIMLSTGVMYQANLFPNSPPSWYLLKYVIYIPSWQMYGELFLENMEGDPVDSCTTNETIWQANGGRFRCPERNAFVPFVAAIYMIVINILLVNLLIAMFSTTYQDIHNRSEQVWRYCRFSLVYEFKERPKAAPPLIFIEHIVRGMYWFATKKCGKKKNHNQSNSKSNGASDSELRMFEHAATESYEIKMAGTANRIDNVIEEMKTIKETVAIKQAYVGHPVIMEPPGIPAPINPVSAREQSDLNMNGQLSELNRQLSELNRQVNTSMSETLKNIMAEQQRQGQQQQQLLQQLQQRGAGRLEMPYMSQSARDESHT